MRSSLVAKKGSTFRSGPYLDRLLRQAEKVDERLQAGICARIRQARIEAGFTQEEAADVLEMTMRGYQNYERTRVPFRKLSRIADVFNVSEQWLLHGVIEPEASEPLMEQMARMEGMLGELLRRLPPPASGGSSAEDGQA